MRLRLWYAMAAALVAASPAAAQEPGDEPEQGEGEGEEGEAQEGGAGMMEATGEDPAETETWDKETRFVPKGKTGDKQEQEEEKKADEPLEVEQTKGAFAEALFGFGGAPIEGPGNPRTGDGTTVALLLGGHWDFSDRFRALVRIPWSTASYDDAETGESVSRSAFGTPELLARLHLGPPKRLTMSLRLGIGIPVAQGTPDVTDATSVQSRQSGVVQRLAAAAGGWHDQELYLMDHMPFTPAFIINYLKGRWNLQGEAKLTLGVKVRGDVASPDSEPPGEFTEQGLAAFGVVGGHAAYEVFEPVSGMLRAWAVYNAVRPFEYDGPATGPNRFQFVIEPRVFARFGIVQPAVGLVVPVGGELGGEMLGLRLLVDLIF